MTAEDKQQLLQGMFNGAQLTNVQVIGVVEAGAKVVYKEVQAGAYGHEEATDEQVARAIEAINGSGKPLNTKQRWAGVHWLLRWAYNYPAKPQEFCERVAQLPLPADLEYKCDYRNIRELSTLSFMNQDPREMDKVKPSKNDEQVFYQLREVALALMAELQK